MKSLKSCTFLVIVMASFASACSTSLSTMAPARTFKPGEGAASIGYQVSLSTQGFDGALGAGRSIYKEMTDDSNDRTYTKEDARKMLATGLMIGLFMPSYGPEVTGRVGVWDGIDLGFRYNGNVKKGDARFRLWQSESEAFALSAMLGYGSHSTVVGGSAEWLTLSNWLRKDYDIQLNFGYERSEFLKAYFAPRLLVSTIDPKPKFDSRILEYFPEEVRKYDTSQYFTDTTMIYYGATLGTMLGYKYAYIALELNLFRVDLAPQIFDETIDLSGWTMAPNIGLVMMWH